MAEESENRVLALLQAIQGGMEAMRADQAAMRSDMSHMKAAQAATDAKVDNLAAKLDRTDAKVDRLTAKVDVMDGKLDRVIARADDILAGQVRLRTDMENQDVPGIRRDLNALTARVEVLEARRG